ncbi:universal stress protein [Chloroflexi bacterium TSY]|nr:universal stress protein [Chloroflexi bacterium TSY]
MFNHILVPLDGSSLAECVLPHVAAFAKIFGSQVTLLHVMECAQDGGHLYPIDPLDWQITKAERQANLDHLVERLRNQGMTVTSVVLEGKAARTIIDYALGHNVDLITLSSHGESGHGGWNVGGVSQKVILHGHTSTLVIRAYLPTIDAQSELRYRRILVPLDGSRRSECVLGAATALIRAYAAQLVLAHVVRKPEMPRPAPLLQEDITLVNRLVERNRQEATKYLAQVQAQILADDVETRLIVSDEVASSLHDLVEEEEIDLVVMAAHGYSAQRKWPHGSMTTSFIAYGSTPLLFMQDMPQHEMIPTAAQMAATEYKGH